MALYTLFGLATSSQPVVYVAPVATTTIPAIMVRIAYCESGNKQFLENGQVVRGIINPKDIGRWQINLDHHGARANELGIDLFTEEGNTEYALLLYKEQGTKPWFWSEKCWSQKSTS